MAQAIALQSRIEDAHRIWLTYHDGNLTPPPEKFNEPILENRSSSSPFGLPHVASEPVVAVVGVGYVGTHLVTAFAKHVDVIAYDVSAKRLKSVEAEVAHLPKIFATTDPQSLGNATHFLVAVPTLVRDNGEVDTTHLRDALATVALHAQPGSTIIIESSVAVGMTRSLLKGMLSSRNLKAGMSPERVDPGRIHPAFEDIPKIVSGLDDISPGSLASIQALYSRVFSNVVPVSSPEVAEMTKLYENCQRMICIAYANEMADACTQLNIDPFEVARAAATKPFGYLPMTPSAGVGGHCIPVNPHYLFSTSEFPILKSATQFMKARPQRLVDRALRSLLKDSKRERGCAVNHCPLRALVVGMGFKKGQDVLSHSPGLAMANHLQDQWGTDVEWADPYVGQEAIPHIDKFDVERRWNTADLSKFDIVFVAMEQHGLDFETLKSLHRTKVELWCPTESVVNGVAPATTVN